MKKLKYSEIQTGEEPSVQNAQYEENLEPLPRPLILECKEVLDSDKTKIEQLTAISNLTKPIIRDSSINISPKFWTTVSAGFIDLLDQIIFEILENKTDISITLQEYIIDDMLIKLSIYIDALTDITKYKKNFMCRSFLPEDAKIISYYALNDLIPNMLKEFDETPHLRKHIIKSLLCFNLPELVSFYADIIQEDYGIETKSYALCGVKEFEQADDIFNNIQETANSSLIHYASNFDTSNLPATEMPYTFETIFFAVAMIQTKSEILYEQQNFIWFSDTALCSNEFKNDNPKHGALFAAITETLLSLSPYELKKILNNDEVLKKFANLIDLMPREEFDKMTSFLDALGNEFTNSLNRLIETGKLELDKARSNILSYLMWTKGIDI